MIVNGKNIIRVFPTKTRATPDDVDAYFDDPPALLLPDADEVHVSCLFSWDKPKAERLAEAWGQYYQVRVGGPAYDAFGDEFVPGLYLRHGYTITSRGCPNNCGFCMVTRREGAAVRLLPIRNGWILQDNNILACPDAHVQEVFEMLAKQKEPIRLLGGIEAALLTDWHVNLIAGIRRRLRWLFTAYDEPNDYDAVRDAITRLRKAGLSHGQVHCFVLCGRGNDTPSEAYARCQSVFDMGGVPFPSFFLPTNVAKREVPKEWKSMLAEWATPQIIFARNKRERTTS